MTRWRSVRRGGGRRGDDATLGLATELLERLVAIDTTSHRSNLELIELVEAELDQFSIPHERVVPTAATAGGGDEPKAGLLARIGPDVEGGVVLSAHTDCVPASPAEWTHDPFTLQVTDDRFYGRGVADMKGCLAVILASLGRLATTPLQRPVLLAFSHDEEVGTVGAPGLVERLLATQARPAAVLVGEPTSMEVVNAHKGVRTFTTVVEGVAGHSSRPDRAANAIAAATRIAGHIAELADAHRREAADDRFEPPYTTFNLGTIAGGQAVNIVPPRCVLTWEYRPVPADDSTALRAEVDRFVAEQVLPDLRAETGAGQVTTTDDSVARALAAEPDGAAESLARIVAGYDGPGRTVAFGTDGGHFQAAGLSTVVVGPGSIDQAHRPDEWIAIEQLNAYGRMLHNLAACLTA